MTPFGVVFDLDGLLVDSERVQAMAFNEVLSPYGIRLSDEDFAKLVGISTAQNFADLARMHPRLAIDLHAIIRAKDRAYAALVPVEMRAMPGAPALVERLSRAGVPMAVASSSFRGDVESCLRQVGLDALLATVSPGDEVPRTKPWPDVYLRAAGMLGLAPARCVALEDAVAGVKAAKAAGMRCIAVPNRYTRGHDFAAADLAVDGLPDVTLAALESLVLQKGGGPAARLPGHPPGS